MNRSSLVTPDTRPPGSHDGLRRLGMTTEEELRFFAFGSAVFLLFGILADRTSETTGNAHSMSRWSDAGIYNLAASLSGVVAIAGLSVAVWLRPRLVIPVLASLLASAAFGLSIVTAGVYVVTRVRGEIFLYGCTCPWRPGHWDGVHPAVGPFFATAAALTGATATLALIVVWLHDARGR